MPVFFDGHRKASAHGRPVGWGGWSLDGRLASLVQVIAGRQTRRERRPNATPNPPRLGRHGDRRAAHYRSAKLLTKSVLVLLPVKRSFRIFANRHIQALADLISLDPGSGHPQVPQRVSIILFFEVEASVFHAGARRVMSLARIYAKRATAKGETSRSVPPRSIRSAVMRPTSGPSV